MKYTMKLEIRRPRIAMPKPTRKGKNNRRERIERARDADARNG